MKSETIIKKIYAVVMSFVMMFTVVPVNFVTAAKVEYDYNQKYATPESSEGYTINYNSKFAIELTADKSGVTPGDEVTLSVDLKNLSEKIEEKSNIVALSFYVKYDNSKLEVINNKKIKEGKFTYHAMYEDSFLLDWSGTQDPNVMDSEGKIKFVSTTDDTINRVISDQNIAKIKFRVKDNVSGKINFGTEFETFTRPIIKIEDEVRSDWAEGVDLSLVSEINNTDVKVLAPLQKIELDKSSLELNVGESSEKLVVKYFPTDTTDDKTVTWTSSDTSVATVVDGVVTASSTKVGTATITAKVGSKSVNIPVVVKAPLKGININKSEISLVKGGSEKLTVTLNPTFTTDNPTFVWTSDNEAVAKVDNTGMVTAVGKGNANITVKTSDNKFSKTCKVGVTVPIESITVSDKNVTLERGVDGKETKIVTVTVNPSDATDEVNVAWVSNNEDIATVERIDKTSAKITAVSNGNAEITATLAGKSDKVQVTVVTPIKSIALNKASDEITAGQTDTLTVTYNPTDTTTAKNVTWTTSDSSIATVVNGTVKAVKPGKVTITATLDADKNIKAECVYTVLPVPMSGVQLDKKSATINKGQSVTLVAKVLPENTTDDKTVTWTTSDSKVATVDSTGKVTAVGKGTATITATSAANSSLKDECTVTVLVPLTGLSIDKTAITLEKGVTGKGTAVLTATKMPEDTTDTSTVTYTSSNIDVAVVDSTGKVTAVGKGTATITVTAGSFTKKCNVEVIVPLDSIAINEQDVEVYLKTTKQLTVKVNPTDASVEGKTVTWKSSDEKIAKVDDKGVVTPVSEGKVTITATLAGKESTTTVTVKRLALNSIAIKEDISTMKKGQTAKLSVVAEPEKTTDDYVITWTSSDEAIATVDSTGKVTALKEGKVTITATSNIEGVKPASIDIDVTEVKMETVSVNKLSIEKDDLCAGKEFKLTFKVNPEDTTDSYKVIWVSSDESIATIDNEGNVKALKEGKVKFTVQAIAEDGSEITDTYEVYINPAKTEKVETPNTGDMNVYVVLLAMVVCGMVMLSIIKRRKVNVK